jgi:DNA/RNA endonuclease G (NUC1)
MKFRPEPALPLSAPGAVDDDYRNSDFDRGHQAQSADFKSSAELMTDTFVLSNVVPQEGPGFNRTIWRDLEDLVRMIALRRGELYVITGPVYQKAGTVRVSADTDTCGNAIELKPPGKRRSAPATSRCRPRYSSSSTIPTSAG